jgi:CheY-like chemotaxis protein/HPt (histidine-containing phosphotransfer) domain-containing protein
MVSMDFQPTARSGWRPATGKLVPVVATWVKAGLEDRIMLVLVINANEPSRSVLEQQIRQLGVLAMGAGSLQEALPLMRATAVDRVLIDCQSPETLSADALQALNDVAGNQPQFIGITRDSQVEALAALRAAGLGHFVPPGPDQEQLRQVLLQPAQQSHDGDEPAEPLMNQARLEDLLEISRISGRESVEAIVDTFVQSSETRLVEIQLALEAADQATLRRIRHGWAGISGSLGAGRLAQTLKTLDPVEMLHSDEYSRELLARLRLEFDDTRAFFAAFTQGLI